MLVAVLLPVYQASAEVERPRPTPQKASASSFIPGHEPIYAFDSNAVGGHRSWYQSENMEGQWIEFDLGDTAQEIANMSISLFRNHEIEYEIEIQFSQDGEVYNSITRTKVKVGKKYASKFFPVAQEKIQQTRFIRIIGHGNTVDNSLGIYGISLYPYVPKPTEQPNEEAKPEEEKPKPVVPTFKSASASSVVAGNEAAFAADRDNDTLFQSENRKGEWLLLDLEDTAAYVGTIGFKFLDGDVRENWVEIQTSLDDNLHNGI